MRLPALAILALWMGLASGHGYDSPYPPDYAAIRAAADIMVEARVLEVKLPPDWSKPTKVTLLIEVSHKGPFKKGQQINVFHDSGRILQKRISTDEFRPSKKWRCPPYAEFTPGAQATVYAKWDEKKKRYEVPGAKWVILKTSRLLTPSST